MATAGKYQPKISQVLPRGRSGGTGSVTVDNLTLKQVLTPSTSGATIVTAKGGTTYNFNYEHASFAFNEASYFCVVRKLR